MKNEMIKSCDVKKGDIVLLGNDRLKFIIIGERLSHMSRRAAYTIEAVRFCEADKYISGDIKKYYTVRISTHEEVEKVGEYDKVDIIVAKVLVIQESIVESQKKREEEIKYEFDSTRMEYTIILQDGTKVFAGDRVKVQFSNGVFNMILGNAKKEMFQKKGFIYVRQRVGKQARSINYKNLLGKV